MGWLWAAECAAAPFAWRVGIGSGLFGILIATVLVATAPAYHPDIKRAFSDTTRTRVQWGLTFAPLLLLVLWIAAVWHLGWAQLTCFAEHLALGTLVTTCPFVLVFMFSAAQWIGRAGAR